MDNVEKGLATAIKSPVDVSSEESSVEVPARTRSRSDAGTEHDQSGGEWSISESRTAKDYESHKLGLWQAVAINTLNMFGTGPFITIPYLFSATNPAGPQAMIGYAYAAIFCVADSMVWGELTSTMPYSGGSYIYLRESYGKDKWGRLVAFLYIFQFLISAPIEIASGFLAMSQYLAYVTRITNTVYNSLIAAGFCVVSVGVLYQDLSFVGKLSIILWIGTVGAIIFSIVAGFMNFNPELLALPDDFPPSAPSGWASFFFTLGTATRIGLYDFAGYYDACQMADEVKNPRRNIPKSCIWTCAILCPTFIVIIIAISGVVPWTDLVEKMLVGDLGAIYVMSTFCEMLLGRPFAIFFTFVVVYTIFGSCFALLLGYAFIPYSAARDGYFYAWFGHEHATKKGLADYSLLFLGALSAALCFVDLSLLIEGMLTTRVLVQFILQAIGVVILRKKAPNALRVYKMPMYPLPIIVSVTGFAFVFCTTQNWIVVRRAPLLEIGILTIIVGIALYFPFAKINGFWPFPARAGQAAGEAGTETSPEASNPLADATVGENCNSLAESTDLAESSMQMVNVTGPSASAHSAAPLMA